VCGHFEHRRESPVSQISAASRLHLGCISARSRLHLGYIWRQSVQASQMRASLSRLSY